MVNILDNRADNGLFKRGQWSTKHVMLRDYTIVLTYLKYLREEE